jgi:chromosome segregation ATPase
MPTTKREELSALVERLEAEVERLEGRLQAARQSARKAEEELGEIRARREEIGLEVFEEDEEAVEELARLRTSAASSEEALEVSSGAADKLVRLLEEAKGRLAEEKRNLHRQRYEELARERYALDGEIEAAAHKLAEGLDRLSGLDGKQHAEGRAGGLDPSYDIHDLTRGWLSSRFRDYLPFGAEVQAYYRKPLVEVDRKASGAEA